MVVVKVSAALVAVVMLVCHVQRSQSAPARSGLDSVSLSDSEARRLLNAIIREFIHMSNEEGEEGNSLDRPLDRPLNRPLDRPLDRPLVKRCSGLSTCVLGKLSQDLHKLQTFPRTNVGAGTPGRKRSLGPRLGLQD